MGIEKMSSEKKNILLSFFCELGKFKIDNPFPNHHCQSTKKPENHLPIMRVMCPTPLNIIFFLTLISVAFNLFFTGTYPMDKNISGNIFSLIFILNKLIQNLVLKSICY